MASSANNYFVRSVPSYSAGVWKVSNEAPSHIGLGTLTKPQLLSLHPSSSSPLPSQSQLFSIHPSWGKNRFLLIGRFIEGSMRTGHYSCANDGRQMTGEGAEEGIWRGLLKCQERRYIGLLGFLSCPLFQQSAWVVSWSERMTLSTRWMRQTHQHNSVTHWEKGWCADTACRHVIMVILRPSSPCWLLVTLPWQRKTLQVSFWTSRNSHSSTQCSREELISGEGAVYIYQYNI